MHTLAISGAELPVYEIDTIVIGSGCAGFNAADTLHEYGRRDIAILTEGLNMGTSRNTGSDKQTFYKLSLAPDEADSVGEMADTLFSCGGMHGDTALIEAACSIRSFIKLVNAGVPFPTDPYGAYVGYKTDHDPRRRATSAGPYTSKYMTECLERRVKEKGVRIFDGMSVVKLLVKENACYGALAVDEAHSDEETGGLTLFFANHVVLATGGPAGVYAASVYPESQTGMTGMALEAGARAENLMDWQYGLASTKFRWNVSGTYQQVLPRYIAVSTDGSVREFLPEYFDDPMEAVNMVFMKGYQWPFDVRKIPGSSIIDIIIHHEIAVKGNRVYMDFLHEPAGLAQRGFTGLSAEAYEYLKNSNALLPLPIERLKHMNAPAIALYQDHGIDLTSEPLEVNICAQHNNGGLAVDMHWQSSVQGLYVVGEAAGTFGAYRPGGTALASTQTGAQRAAEHIACTAEEAAPRATLDEGASAHIAFVLSALRERNQASTHLKTRLEAQTEMSTYAAHLRDKGEMERLLQKRAAQLETFFGENKITNGRELSQLYRTRDTLITQCAVLSSMILTAGEMGSRGSGLLIGADGTKAGYHLDHLEFAGAKDGFHDRCVATCREGNGFVSTLAPVRPVPKGDTWFENVWKEYLERTRMLRKEEAR